MGIVKPFDRELFEAERICTDFISKMSPEITELSEHAYKSSKFVRAATATVLSGGLCGLVAYTSYLFYRGAIRVEHPLGYLSLGVIGLIPVFYAKSTISSLIYYVKFLRNHHKIVEVKTQEILKSLTHRLAENTLMRLYNKDLEERVRLSRN